MSLFVGWSTYLAPHPLSEVSYLARTPVRLGRCPSASDGPDGSLQARDRQKSEPPLSNGSTFADSEA
eukprot:1282680-Alexandrium_andersonii.AAC.1